MGVILDLKRKTEMLERTSAVLTARVNAMLEVVNAQNEAIEQIRLPWWRQIFRRQPILTLKIVEPWEPEPEVAPKNIMGATVVGRIYEHK